MATPDQFAGLLVGQCLGDALGFPVEGSPPETCAPYVTLMRTLGAENFSRSRSEFPIGQYTDDSQLARELMQSFADCGRFDAEDYAARICAIFREDRIVGRGLATDAAARRLAQGISWRESGAPSPDAGNGSAMRAGPLAGC